MELEKKYMLRSTHPKLDWTIHDYFAAIIWASLNHTISRMRNHGKQRLFEIDPPNWRGTQWLFFGDRTGRTAKIFGRNKGKLQIWWFHTKFCGCFWYLYFSVVPFGELFDDDVWHFKYLISGYGVRSCEICPMFFEDLEQNKTDLYRSGAVLEQRRWEWENFGWGWKEVKQSGDSKTASRISRLWVDHSRKMSLLAYLAVDPSLSDRSFVTDPFQALTSGARVACGTCRWLTSTESTTSLRGQEILRWALPAVALLVGLFVEHAARAELMPLWSSLFVHFL